MPGWLRIIITPVSRVHFKWELLNLWILSLKCACANSLSGYSLWWKNMFMYDKDSDQVLIFWFIYILFYLKHWTAEILEACLMNGMTWGMKPHVIPFNHLTSLGLYALIFFVYCKNLPNLALNSSHLNISRSYWSSLHDSAAAKLPWKYNAPPVSVNCADREMAV